MVRYGQSGPETAVVAIVEPSVPTTLSIATDPATAWRGQRISITGYLSLRDSTERPTDLNGKNVRFAVKACTPSTLAACRASADGWRDLGNTVTQAGPDGNGYFVAYWQIPDNAQHGAQYVFRVTFQGSPAGVQSFAVTPLAGDDDAAVALPPPAAEGGRARDLLVVAGLLAAGAAAVAAAAGTPRGRRR